MNDTEQQIQNNLTDIQLEMSIIGFKIQQKLTFNSGTNTNQEKLTKLLKTTEQLFSQYLEDFKEKKTSNETKENYMKYFTKFKELNETIKEKKKQLLTTIPQENGIELKSTRTSEAIEISAPTPASPIFNQLNIGGSIIDINSELFTNYSTKEIMSSFDSKSILKTEFKFNDSTLSTSIVKTDTIATVNEKYTIHVIDVEFGYKGVKKNWFVRRRFSEFKSLDSYIQKTIPNDKMVSTFPYGSYVSNFLSTFEKSFIDDRKKKLDEYLESVVEIFPQGLIVFLEFLSSPFSFLFFSDQNLIMKELLEFKQKKRSLLKSRLCEEISKENFENEYNEMLLKGDEFIVYLKSNFYKMIILSSGKTYLVSWKNLMNPEIHTSKLFYFYLDDVKSISSVPNSFKSDGMESFQIALKTGELLTISSRYKHDIITITDSFINQGNNIRDKIIHGIQSIHSK
eukprot:gene7667-12133_t